MDSNIKKNSNPHVNIKFEMVSPEADNMGITLAFDTPYFTSLGETETSCIFECFQKFLGAAGFSHYGDEGKCLFEEPITDDEYNMLASYLAEIRGKND